MQDIEFKTNKKTVDLSSRGQIVIPITRIAKILVILGVLAVLFVNPTAKAPGIATYAAEHNEGGEESEQVIEAEDAEDREEQRKRLEQKLSDLEAKIAQQQKLIQEVGQKERTLENEIQKLEAEINKLNLQIETVNLTLNKLDRDIQETQQNISKTEGRIEEHKNALARAVRSLYEAESQNMLTILLQNDQISDFFNNVNDLLLVQENINTSLDKVIDLKEKLLEQKEQLGLERQDIENLKEIRQRRKRQVRQAQERQESLLAAARDQKSEHQEILQETRKTAAEIRSQIFRLIGGGELSFERAYELAKLAEGATGVRPALTMAILSRESLLGQNVGSCSYKEAMHPTRDVPVFLSILETLNLNPDSEIARVSCPITQHGSYGGAMGPAQFIPSTWAIYGGYEKEGGNWQYNDGKDRIRDAMGINRPSNPWSNADAFIATALYIQDLKETPGCQEYGNDYNHILPKNKLIERCASAKYYAGSRWWNYRFWYGEAVLEKADEIQRDIDVITS